MSTSVILFACSRVFEIRAAHVGLAASTSLTAWVNSLLLLRRLRRDGIYRPGAGWGGFGWRLLAANLAMAALLLGLMGDLPSWLALGTWRRALRLSELLAAAVVVYFGVLWLLGLRPRDLRSGRGEAV